MKNKKVLIEVARYPDHEMAFILVNKKSVFCGNYWDFHSGCRGTTIAGYDLKDSWDQGIDSLGSCLKMAMEKNGQQVEIHKKILTPKEYQALGF